MATDKKAITFRVSDDVYKRYEIMVSKIQQENMKASKNLIAEIIINEAYQHMIDGTSSNIQQTNMDEFEIRINKKIDETVSKLIDLDKSKKGKDILDKDLLLLEMFEDIELILKILPYSSGYRNPDKTEKTSDIINLVEGKSMFRKYTEKKARAILDKKKKAGGNI